MGASALLLHRIRTTGGDEVLVRSGAQDDGIGVGNHRCRPFDAAGRKVDRTYHCSEPSVLRAGGRDAAGRKVDRTYHRMDVGVLRVVGPVVPVDIGGGLVLIGDEQTGCDEAVSG